MIRSSNHAVSHPKLTSPEVKMFELSSSSLSRETEDRTTHNRQSIDQSGSGRSSDTRRRLILWLRSLQPTALELCAARDRCARRFSALDVVMETASRV